MKVYVCTSVCVCVYLILMFNSLTKTWCNTEWNSLSKVVCMYFKMCVFVFNFVLASAVDESALRKELADFVQDSKSCVKSFPPTLSSLHRRAIHEVRTTYALNYLRPPSLCAHHALVKFPDLFSLLPLSFLTDFSLTFLQLNHSHNSLPNSLSVICHFTLFSIIFLYTYVCST